jgi:hypothetical protein
MPRKRFALDDPHARAAAAKVILQQSMPPRRPKDYDGSLNDAANSLDGKFFGADKVRVELHVLPWRHGLEELEFIAKHINGLIAQVRREATDRSKSLLIRDTLKHWSQAFARRK